MENIKPIIKVKENRCAMVNIMYVFRANFNDTFYIDEIVIDLNKLNNESLYWFDPFNNKSKENNTLVAISYCDDNKMIILEKKDNQIKEHKVTFIKECILCEDYDSSRLLASHISLRTNK